MQLKPKKLKQIQNKGWKWQLRVNRENVHSQIKITWFFASPFWFREHENYPTLSGKGKQRFHIGFDDPAKASGSLADILQEFRRLHNEIKNEFFLSFKNRIRVK